MFRPTNPQISLFESEYVVGPEKRRRLEKSWARSFRDRVLPAIDEEKFRRAFGTTGRPNKSIKLLVGLHILKEMNDLTDEQVIEQLEYNLQWHYALGVAPESAHVCQKTLHTFRCLLTHDDVAQAVFVEVTRNLAGKDGIKFGRQRLDSTHIISNIAVLTRLGLFVETVTNFLRALRTAEAAVFDAKVSASHAARYLEREGYFSDAKRGVAKRRLKAVAADLYALIQIFEGDAAAERLEAYRLMVRLFDEQCTPPSDEPPSDTGSDERGADAEPVEVALREPTDISSDSLQSPYDPDATYGRKGKGYEAQLAQTCDEGNPYQVVTAVMINGAHESDQRALVPVLKMLQCNEMAPNEMLADTGYGSGANIIAAAEQDVDLVAPVQDPDAPPRVDRFLEGRQEHLDSADDPDREWDLGDLEFDETYTEVFACPAGVEPISQQLTGERLTARFGVGECTTCEMADRCPLRELSNGDRQLSRKPQSIATETRQAEQRQRAFLERYKIRSGIESLNNELKGRHGLGNLRVRRRARVELALVFKALATNVKRAMAYHVAQLLPESATTQCAA